MVISDEDEDDGIGGIVPLGRDIERGTTNEPAALGRLAVEST